MPPLAINPAIRAFADFASAEPTVLAKLREWNQDGMDVASRLSQFAAEHGFQFTAEEYRAAVEKEIRRQHRQAGVDAPPIDLINIGGIGGFAPPLMP